MAFSSPRLRRLPESTASFFKVEGRQRVSEIVCVCVLMVSKLVAEHLVDVAVPCVSKLIDLVGVVRTKTEFRYAFSKLLVPKSEEKR